jgi:thiosulfate/3-mercaptopyruvate sulfurtransferase
MKLAISLAALILLGGPAMAADADHYPRPELLLEPAALAKPERAGQFVVLDARGRKAFDENRLPGARWVDAVAWAKAFGAGGDAEAWSGRIGGLGIGRESTVVVYDANCSKDAARIWWILRYWGLDDVRLLNGGWKGWQAAGLPLETGKPKAIAPKTFQAMPRSKRFASKGRLLTALKDNSLQIVDARSAGEFCGIEKHAAKHGGAIPGAKHLEWIDLLDKKTERFKTAEQLRTLFRAAGVELERPTATYCHSGGRASVMAFTLELMGARDVCNYYASWAEWGNAEDTPIVVAPAKTKK